MTDEQKNKQRDFTSAMGELKGMLNKEGISVDAKKQAAGDDDIPTLDDIPVMNKPVYKPSEKPLSNHDIPTLSSESSATHSYNKTTPTSVSAPLTSQVNEELRLQIEHEIQTEIESILDDTKTLMHEAVITILEHYFPPKK